MFGRRLLGAAVVGGVAYHAGKARQGSADQSASQQQQIDEVQQQQQQQAPAAAPEATQQDKMAQLKQLKDLLDSGVLTQAEFDAQKQKILQSL